jgi:hypothetical protein
MVALLTAIIKLFDLNQNITVYSSYITKVDQLYVLIASELMLPPNERTDANSFIPTQNKNFSNLLGQAPNISTFLYRRALKKYKEFLKSDQGDFICSQKYNSNNYIEIV